jgi:hypothetical protein
VGGSDCRLNILRRAVDVAVKSTQSICVLPSVLDELIEVTKRLSKTVFPAASLQ